MVKQLNTKQRENFESSQRGQKGVTTMEMTANLCHYWIVWTWVTQMLQYRKGEHHLYSTKKKNQSRILYPMKISFKNEGEVKIHSEKQNIANTLPPVPQKNGKQVL